MTNYTCTHRQEKAREVEQARDNTSNPNKKAVLQRQREYMNMSPCADCVFDYSLE